MFEHDSTWLYPEGFENEDFVIPDEWEPEEGRVDPVVPIPKGTIYMECEG